jgi:hypothetical protein
MGRANEHLGPTGRPGRRRPFPPTSILPPMKRSLVFLLAAPALVAFSERGQGVVFAPRDGLVLTKHFTQSDQSALDDMSVSINGAEQDPSMTAMEQELSSRMEVRLTDEYGPMKGGRPARLKRTFDKISSHTDMTISAAMMPEPTEMSMVGESELEGEVVLFKWNEKSGEYDVSFAEDNGSDAKLLDDLAEDTDLRALLPASEVSEGDTWEIDPNALTRVLAFGGSLKLDIETNSTGGMAGMGGGSSTMPSPSEFLGELEGTVTAEYKGTREQDGVRVAVIQLSIAVTTAKDMTEFFKEASKDAEMPEGMDMEMEYNSADMEFGFEGEGLALWNLAAGHLFSFEMSGNTTTTIDMSMAMSVGGMGNMEVDTTLTLTGNQTIKLTVK